MIQTEEYARTFSSYSGSDIAATFNGRVIGELQGLSYSISREVAPIYTMSSADMRGTSRGKRGISGSLVFVTFDRDALIEEMRKDYGGRAPELMSYQTFHANAGSLENQIINGLKSKNANGDDTFGISTWDEQMTRLGYGATGEFNQDNLTGFYTPEYADQLMPFNVTITMANEFGSRSTMGIYGLQILNEGSGFSIDDIVTAKAYSFIARKVTPIEKLDDLRQEGRSSASPVGGDLLG